MAILPGSDSSSERASKLLNLQSVDEQTPLLGLDTGTKNQQTPVISRWLRESDHNASQDPEAQSGNVLLKSGSDEEIASKNAGGVTSVILVLIVGAYSPNYFNRCLPKERKPRQTLMLTPYPRTP